MSGSSGIHVDVRMELEELEERRGWRRGRREEGGGRREARGGGGGGRMKWQIIKGSFWKVSGVAETSAGQGGIFPLLFSLLFVIQKHCVDLLYIDPSVCFCSKQSVKIDAYRISWCCSNNLVNILHIYRYVFSFAQKHLVVDPLYVTFFLFAQNHRASSLHIASFFYLLKTIGQVHCILQVFYLLKTFGQTYCI